MASAEPRNASESRVTVRRRLRRREFQATSRQPGLNSHLNASEVALAAITADGRLLTRALPAATESWSLQASPLGSLDVEYLPPSLFRSFFTPHFSSLSFFVGHCSTRVHKPCFHTPCAPGARKTRHGERGASSSLPGNVAETSRGFKTYPVLHSASSSRIRPAIDEAPVPNDEF